MALRIRMKPIIQFKIWEVGELILSGIDIIYCHVQEKNIIWIPLRPVPSSVDFAMSLILLLGICKGKLTSVKDLIHQKMGESGRKIAVKGENGWKLEE